MILTIFLASIGCVWAVLFLGGIVFALIQEELFWAFSFSMTAATFITWSVLYMLGAFK